MRLHHLLLATIALAPAAHAADPPVIDIVIKDHRFTPAEIHVPTGQVVILRIRNDDTTAEEFDSAALKTEKVVAGGYTASVRLRPLAPGRYSFMGEYHPETAQGVVIAE
jgi:plastocyanin